MFTRKTTLFGCAVILASAACDENRAGDTRNAPATAEPRGNPAPEAPAGGTPVTNTGATVDVDPLASVENSDQVKISPDAENIVPAKQAQLITGFAAAVRSSPSGEAFSTVETTENVTEVARNRSGDYYLIVYPDPNDHAKKRAGWVYKDALEGTDWATSNNPQGGATSPRASQTKATKLHCSRDESHLRTDHDFCGKTCKGDDSCTKKNGGICDGLAFEVHESSSALTNVRYCVSTPPAGGRAPHTK